MSAQGLPDKFCRSLIQEEMNFDVVAKVLPAQDWLISSSRLQGLRTRLICFKIKKIPHLKYHKECD